MTMSVQPHPASKTTFLEQAMRDKRITDEVMIFEPHRRTDLIFSIRISSPELPFIEAKEFEQVMNAVRRTVFELSFG